MSPEDVAPELRAAFVPSYRVPLERRLVRWRLRLAVARMTPPAVEGVTVTEEAYGAARYRLFMPLGASRGPRGAVIWMHGGGYISGSPVMYETRCAEIARRLQVPVLAVRYRLAPAHPFPAALDDCAAVWDDLQRRAAELEVDPRRVAVVGHSAGGGLAAALTQVLADRGGVQPVAQWLAYPMIDDRTAADRGLDAIDHLVWNNRTNRYAWRAYLGRQDPAQPYAVPSRREDLAGLPPAWLGVGTIDLVHAETVAYHRRLVEAAVEATLVEVPGAPHGFDAAAADTAIARGFTDAGLTWLASSLAP